MALRISISINKKYKDTNKYKSCFSGEVDNLLCIGGCGTGKTAFFRFIFHSLEMHYKKDVNLALYCGKSQKEFEEYKNCRLLNAPFMNNKTQLNLFLDKLINISKKRKEKSIDNPIIILMLDCFDLYYASKENKSIFDKLTEIMKNTRDTNIHVFLNTQKTSLLGKTFVKKFDVKRKFVSLDTKSYIYTASIYFKDDSDIGIN